jgi:hypothetical protein
MIMDHIIMAIDSYDITIHSTWLDWTMMLSQLFDHPNENDITYLIKDL